MVMVLNPRENQKVARELSHGFVGVIRGPHLLHALVASAFLTAALAVPYIGVGVAGLVLVVAVAGYGEIIRRSSLADPDEVPPRWRSVLLPRSPWRALLCFLMAAGTVVPLWAMDAGLHQSPHWTRTGALIAGLTWTILPIAMLCTYASDRNGRLGAGRCLKLLGRHAIGTLAALLMIPATLAFVEATLGLVFYLLGGLPYFALDYMPIPGIPHMDDGVPHFYHVDYRLFPPTRFIVGYLDGLRHGYTFSAAIPASLSMSTRAGLSPKIVSTIPGVFEVMRAYLVLMIATCLLTGFAIQARWLGTIVAMEKKRPA